MQNNVVHGFFGCFDVWDGVLQLMQQLMSSNRQRQIQAHVMLLPLAHPHMFKDEAAHESGTTPPELKVYHSRSHLTSLLQDRDAVIVRGALHGQTGPRISCLHGHN